MYASREKEKMTVGDLIDFTTLGKNVQELIKESVAVREIAYAPYSKFKVGAAIRCEDGTIIQGCNVENSAYPAGICAERAAIVKAISDGKRKFVMLAVAADMVGGVVTTPCGLCRQTIAEFGDIPIYLANPNMTNIVKTSLHDLLPGAFHFNGHTM